MHREMGNKWGMALSLSALASALFDSQGDPATIRALLEESLALSREVGDKGGIETGVNPCYQTTTGVNVVHLDSKPFQIRWEAYIPGWNATVWCCTHHR